MPSMYLITTKSKNQLLAARKFKVSMLLILFWVLYFCDSPTSCALLRPGSQTFRHGLPRRPASILVLMLLLIIYVYDICICMCVYIYIYTYLCLYLSLYLSLSLFLSLSLYIYIGPPRDSGPPSLRSARERGPLAHYDYYCSYDYYDYDNTNNYYEYIYIYIYVHTYDNIDMINVLLWGYYDNMILYIMCLLLTYTYDND